MDTNKSLVLSDHEVTTVAPHYGSRRDINHLANQVKAMIPGGDKLSMQEAMATASAAVLSDANILRGDIYAYKDPRSGQLIIVDGYKLLVREAKLQCDYREFSIALTDEEKAIQGLKPEDIAFWVYILRDDKYQGYREEMQTAKDFGLGYAEARREALELHATKALGFVKQEDTWSKKYNKPIDPPKTMTWPEKAIQRGVKHALRRSHRLPTPREIAARTFGGEIQTINEDWPEPEVYATTEEAERHAELAAKERERQDKKAGMDDAELAAYEEEIETATNIMRNNGDDDPIGTPDPEPPEDEAETEPKNLSNPTNPSTRFWTWVYSQNIPREKAGEYIRQADGDFDKALEIAKANAE